MDCHTPDKEEEKSSSSLNLKPPAVSAVSASKDDTPRCPSSISIILFYKYHPLSSNESIVELYRTALQNLCVSLNLKGRILVGCNEHQSEGINGTLSGTTGQLRVFVKAMTATTAAANTGQQSDNNPYREILQTFHQQCQDFYEKAQCPPLLMEESEFKWSHHCNKQDNDNNHTQPQNNTQLFPDLNIKIVKELIGTGGVLAKIPLQEIHQGYLTPQEWHQRVMEYNQNRCNNDNQKSTNNDNTILIDCRNTKECQIGHFAGALDPQTTTFNQFTQWVQSHQTLLQEKKVLMYCTGGIRCEKASAYIRRTVPTVQEVRHLKGGIHKYLEEFGGGSGSSGSNNGGDAARTAQQSMWKGKNFVFDGRGAHGPPSPPNTTQSAKLQSSSGADDTTMDTTEAMSSQSQNNEDIVGACRYCSAPYDTFDPHCVCTVCREPILICRTCQDKRCVYHREYHCHKHQHLQECYFTDLSPFSADELQQQLEQLHSLVAEIAVGKKFRARRKTLLKQCEKIQDRIKELANTAGNDLEKDKNGSNEWKCRNCGQVGCSGRCWGFHSLKRKRLLEEQQKAQQGSTNCDTVSSNSIKKANRQNGLIKQQKEAQRLQQIGEWKQLGLTEPPRVGRNPDTGIRIPAPCTRILETTTKAKWCGKPLLKMMEGEFPDLTATNDLSKIFKNALIRVNNIPVRSAEEAESMLLKNMDVVSRIVHWHEPPVLLESDRIDIQKINLPEDLFPALDSSEDCVLYVCNKPSSVPVHPAGPYLSNSMTIMVEAQEDLPPKSLIPCHRIDRVTSGLTICCTNPQVARVVQSTIAHATGNRMVRKQYTAKVHGRFPSFETDSEVTGLLPACSDLAKWSWVSTNIDDQPRDAIQVDAPIETIDPANGIRSITTNGKPSTSHFYLIEYDAATDTSIVSCSPLTGRSHQLRVHLQWLGYPIVNDVQYGGMCEDGIVKTAVDAMKERLKEDTNENAARHMARGISSKDEEAARRVCSTCTLGPEASFSEAQLLQGGHSICLHACRYQLTLTPVGKSKKKAKKANETFIPSGESFRHTVDARVDLPKWAAHIKL